MKHLGTLIFIIILLMGIPTIFIVHTVWYEPGEKEVTVIIPKGARMQDIAATMQREWLIPHPFLFQLLALRHGAYGKLKAGEYHFSYGDSPYDAMIKMQRGEVVVHSITIPEGWMTSQVIEAVKQIPELEGDVTESFVEGELLPETYQFTHGDTRLGLLMRMRDAMQAELARQMRDTQPPLDLSAAQVLTLASIVEKEARLPAERPHIAAVYLNRLRLGMRLQADPTTIYALTEGKRELGRLLTTADLAMQSPYNTYQVTGLPPAPICNPGKASIEAVLHPINSDDLFFVADGQGGHRFAKTVQGHAENVKEFRRWQSIQDVKR